MSEKDQNKINKDSGEKTNGSNTLIVLVLILFVVAAVGFAWAYNNYKQSQKMIKKLKNKQQKQNQDQKLKEKQRQRILSKVEKHMVLPEGQPAIISINNPEELSKREDFFKSAQRNDFLLLYRSKAILYRSSTDKIVDVQPVRSPNTNTNDIQRQKKTNNSDQENTISIDIRNGGAGNGAASSLAEQLNKKTQFNVTNIGNATSTYKKTSLIHNNTAQDISLLEQELGVSSTLELPPEESSSNADAVIFVSEQNN